MTKKTDLQGIPGRIPSVLHSMLQTTRTDHYRNNPGNFSIEALFLKTLHEHFKNWLQIVKELGVKIKASWHNTLMEHTHHLRNN